MKQLIIALTIVLTVAFCGSALAESITLPDGQIVPLDGLTVEDKKKMMNYIDKISKAQKAAKTVSGAEGVVEVIKSADPKAINEWRELITGTIRDIASDLNVSVNEFLKTPAGMGVAGLVIYKVAGKEVLGEIFDILLAVPMWLTIMLILWYLQRQYLTTAIIYKTIGEEELANGKKKVTKSHPYQEHKYDWKSDESRTVFSCFLYGTMLMITFVSILIVFA